MKYRITSSEPEDTIESILLMAGFDRWKADDYAKEIYRQNGAIIEMPQHVAEKLKDLGMQVSRVVSP